MIRYVFSTVKQPAQLLSDHGVGLLIRAHTAHETIRYPQTRGTRSGLSHHMSASLPAASFSRFHCQQLHHTGGQRSQ